MNIFFDLDGTLINSKERLYRLFQYLVPQSSLSFDQYWEYKQNKIGHKEILTSHFGFSEADFERFEGQWMTAIEQEEWLNYDQPFEGTTAFLQFLAKENQLFIVTARQSSAMVRKQLASFAWENLFTGVFVTEQKLEKHTLIQNNVTINPNDWMIGDTGLDIQVGKKLGIQTVAVLSGFLNREKLEEYQPDLIIDVVTSFKL